MLRVYLYCCRPFCLIYCSLLDLFLFFVVIGILGKDI